MSDGRRSRLGRDEIAAIMLARDEGVHYREVAAKYGVSPKYVLNIWSGRRLSRETGLPDQSETRPTLDRPRLSEGGRGIGLTDEDVADLFHEAPDWRWRYLALHVLKLRGVIRDHLE